MKKKYIKNNIKGLLNRLWNNCFCVMDSNYMLIEVEIKIY